MAKGVHQHFGLHGAHLAGLDDDRVHPAAIAAGATLIAIEPASRIPWRKYAHWPPAGSITILDVPTVLTRFEIFEDFLEVQENVRREVVGALRTFGLAVRRIPRPLLQRVGSIRFMATASLQPLQELHVRYSLLLCEKELKASFAAPMAFRASNSSAMVTLPITLLSVGFHQIDDLRSMGSYELAVDIGAIKGSYCSRGFKSFHLCHPSLGFGFTKVPVSLRTRAHQILQCGSRAGGRNFSKRRHCSCRMYERSIAELPL